MNVTPLYDVEFNALRAVFPQELTPPFAITDQIGEYASTGFPKYSLDGVIRSGNDSDASGGAQGLMEFDPIAKCIHAQHVVVMHDQVYLDTPPPVVNDYGYDSECIDSNNLPIFRWFSLKTTDGKGVRYQPLIPSGWFPMGLKFSTAEDFQITGWPCVAAQGFTATIGVQVPTGAVQQITRFTLRFRVAGSSLTAHRWYGITWTISDGVSFGYNDHNDVDGYPVEAGWTFVDRIKTSSLQDDLLVPVDPKSGFPVPVHIAEVKFIAGVLQIKVDGQTAPFHWPHEMFNPIDGLPDWVIDRWELVGVNLLGAIFGVHPMFFAAEAATVSVQENIGFTPSAFDIANMGWRVHFAPNTGYYNATNQVGFCPPECVAFAQPFDLNGTIFRYQVGISNKAIGTYQGWTLSNFTAAVSAVSFDFAGSTFSIVQAPTVLGTLGAPPLPEVIEVTNTWDVTRLTASSTAAMTFNNFHALWTNSAGTGVVDSAGHFAAQVKVGIAEFNNGTQVEFTGVFNTDFEAPFAGGGNDRITIHGQDCSIMLQVPVWNLPWFDGWNFYYVMAYLAAKGGITPAQLDFLPYVPATPYDYSPGLPLDQQYFLPIGPAGTAITRFTGGQNIWDIMLKISQTIGFVTFFNIFGALRTFKFQVPLPISPVKHFQYYGTQSLQEVWNGSYSGGLRETRNNITAIGLNAYGPLWNPIVAHSSDDASVFDHTVANFKGYYDPVVWVDSVFANPSFAQAATDSLLVFLRLPDRSISLTTWYAGDVVVQPGDMIAISYPRTGASLIPFFVTQKHTRVVKGEPPTMQLSGRIVPTVPPSF